MAEIQLAHTIRVGDHAILPDKGLPWPRGSEGRYALRWLSDGLPDGATLSDDRASIVLPEGQWRVDVVWSGSRKSVMPNWPWAVRTSIEYNNAELRSSEIRVGASDGVVSRFASDAADVVLGSDGTSALSVYVRYGAISDARRLAVDEATLTLHMVASDGDPGAADNRLIPAGGGVGDVLAKNDAQDYEIHWLTPYNAAAGVERAEFRILEVQDVTSDLSAGTPLTPSDWTDAATDAEGGLFLDVNGLASLSTLLFYGDDLWVQTSTSVVNRFVHVRIPATRNPAQARIVVASQDGSTYVEAVNHMQHLGNNADDTICYYRNITRLGATATSITLQITDSDAHIGTTKYVGRGSVPAGGTRRQVLQKVDGDDYNVGWMDAVEVTDVSYWQDGSSAGGTTVPLTAGTAETQIEGSLQPMQFAAQATPRHLHLAVPIAYVVDLISVSGLNQLENFSVEVDAANRYYHSAALSATGLVNVLIRLARASA